MTELDARRVGRITGSRVASVLGVDPYRTADQLLAEMVAEYRGEPASFTGNEATEYGNLHEPDAIDEYERTMGVEVHSAQRFTLHPMADFVGVTPDGLVGSDGMLEVKCPFRAQYVSIEQRPAYHAQIMLQLSTTGRAWCDFVIWRRAEPIIVQRVNADPWYMDSVWPVLAAFRGRYEQAIL